jgi:ParB family transcriptional regulator, chromosome partitioning protein
VKPKNSSNVFAAVVQSQDASKDRIIDDLRKKLDEASQVGASEVSVDLIDPSPFQCRTYFDEQEMDQLTASIREYGVITPLIVRVIGKRYELIAGDRRRICSQNLGLTTVPVRVLPNVSDDQAAKLVLIENLKRSDISPIEEVRSVLALMARMNLPGYDTTEKIVSDLKKIRLISNSKSKTSCTREQENLLTAAKNIIETTTKNRWESFLSNRLPLVDLPIFVQDLVVKGLEYTKAKMLAKVTKALGEKEGLEIAQKAVDEKLSLAEIRSFLPEATNVKKIVAFRAGKPSFANHSNSFELIAAQLKDISSYTGEGTEFSESEIKELEEMLDSIKAKIKGQDA